VSSVARSEGPLFDDATLDLEALRGEKLSRVKAEMSRRGLDALWLLGPGHLRYVVGSAVVPADGARATHERASLVVARDSEHPHLFTPYPEAAPSEIPAEFVHAPLPLETAADVDDALRVVHEAHGGGHGAALAIDEYSAPLYLRLLGEAGALLDAAEVIAAVKLCKTPAEIECIRRAQAINERAMHDVQSALRSGLRQTDLSALFFARIFELGVSANGIDPIWQVMSPRIANGPWTTHGGVAFPTCTTDRILRRGDVLWVDTGVEYHGYQSDFGRTFLVDAEPSARQLDQARRWLDVVEGVLALVRPGVTGGDLTHRAREIAGGSRPWLDHFYLIHGVGTEPAEQPLIGTDLGDDFDESIVLAPGMVLVLEPAIWDDGHGGYRSEEIVAVTETGYLKLSDYPYTPFEASIGAPPETSAGEPLAVSREGRDG
jgi:Xaa-Pro aminopeptidase